jgi:putative ATP-dependent DNA ligase
MSTKPVGVIGEGLLAEARELQRIRELEYEGLRYLRFSDKHHGIPRGTVMLDGRVVPGYPSIGRIFTLEAGLRGNIHGPFLAEEKVDGYNVRVVRHEGVCLAFSRGGFVCPFTTDRLADLGPFDALLTDEPELVVCGEVAGPDNPYINAAVPAVDHDIAFFAFDLMQLLTRPSRLPAALAAQIG